MMLFPGAKWLGYEINCSLLTSPEVKDEWRCTPILLYAFVACAGTTVVWHISY